MSLPSPWSPFHPAFSDVNSDLLTAKSNCLFKVLFFLDGSVTFHWLRRPAWNSFLVISLGLAYCPSYISPTFLSVMYELPMLTSRSVSFPYLISLHLSPALLSNPLCRSTISTRFPSLSLWTSTYTFPLFSRQTPLDSIQEFSIQPPHYSTHYSPPTNLFLI